MDRRQFLVASQSDLVGVCDIHLHAAPDSKARSLSEYDMALEAKAAGYRAVLFKSNDFSCHDRAYLLRQAIPGIELFGSIVLNRATGASLNVYAVEKALATTGNLCRTVWMPTLDAEYAVRTFKQNTPFIRVSDGNGKLLPETLKIMELCAQADIAFATGHSSPAESLLMAQALMEKKVPVELHIYPEGVHGLSLGTEQVRRADGTGVNEASRSWMELACDWIRRLCEEK